MDIYQGDPRLILTENGSKIIFIGGQPVMDQGLENLALISLFTKRGWVGNIFFKNPDEKIGSDFEESFNQPITLNALNDIRDAAEKALDNPAFGNVTATVLNPESNRITVKILIQPPGQDVFELIITKHGLNWIAQANNPAYIRVQ